MATREVPHVLGMKGNLMHFVQEQFGAENLDQGRERRGHRRQSRCCEHLCDH